MFRRVFHQKASKYEGYKHFYTTWNNGTFILKSILR